MPYHGPLNGRRNRGDPSKALDIGIYIRSNADARAITRRTGFSSSDDISANGQVARYSTHRRWKIRLEQRLQEMDALNKYQNLLNGFGCCFTPA